MTLKLNWGFKIALLYGGFVALIVVLVSRSMHQQIDLVAKDYYAQEIKYQHTIDAGKNQAALSTPVALSMAADKLTLTFPKEFEGKASKVHALFYSPVNAMWDKTVDQSISSNVMEVPRADFKNTTYKVKLNWECEGKNYYQESELQLH